jgi:RNA polymerase sigma-70 factor (ECF subfamily)
VLGRLDRAAIATALSTLSAVQREAIELAYFGGLTQADIAERTGDGVGHRQEPRQARPALLRDAMISVAGEP